MDFTKEDLELETVSVEPSDICLSSSAQKCQVCKTGTVVKVGRKTDLIIYTRSGTLRGIHEERRCNNRTLPCRAGHFHGYVKSDQTKVLDDNILQNKYLITSNQTAFAIDYLWDITLQILFMRATFEGLGNVYNNLHYTNLPLDTLLKRESLVRKRIAEAFYLFAFIELGQRYDIEMVIPNSLEECILENKSQFHEFFRKVWTKSHKCEVNGCGQVITMDGGLKPHRKLCASKGYHQRN